MPWIIGRQPRIRRALAVAVLGIAALTRSVHAQPSLPSAFKARTVASPEGADIFVRSAGAGPVVVLLHGYAETSDSWGPLAAELVKSYTVVVPDLRGMGHSSRPLGGYDKKTQAADIRAVVTALGYDRASVVAHDIGDMVAYAYAARYPDKVERLVVMDAPIPGIAPWDEIVRNPELWHFSFHGPDAERLVQGRERIYLDRIWNAFSGDPGKPDEATRAFYSTQYALPGAMRAGFAQFTAFSRDVEDNKVFQRTKLAMPVLAIGGEKSFGAMEAAVMRNVAVNVREAVVPGAGHWLMEESPAFTIALISAFLAERTAVPVPPARSDGERRIAPGEFKFPDGAGAGAGTSGVSGIRTLVLKGDPEHAGLYTIMLRIPANTRIAAHTHQDDRVATVVSGTWYIGYGDRFNSASLKALPPGSFYTEPANTTHFAETRDEPVLVQITGVGPSSTSYVDPASDPRGAPSKP
jgi:pimeloyl-ACP methyl ester carboxylesterase/quercetin dioxygenase-like cupin family protein